jgi:hypothetical protein
LSASEIQESVVGYAGLALLDPGKARGASRLAGFDVDLCDFPDHAFSCAGSRGNGLGPF